jgi:hypothetical protein
MSQVPILAMMITLVACKAPVVQCQESGRSSPILSAEVSAMPIEVPDREVWNHRLGYRRRIRTAKFGDLGYLGGVRLTLIIGTDGNVISANVTEGPKEFYAEAIGLAQAWKYKPFLRGGHPIVAQIQDKVAILPPERLPSTHVPFPTVEDWKSLVITLERTGCYGTCPSYKVEIHGDGTVLYTGKAFVAVSGKHSGRITQSSVLQLLEGFRAADYFSLDDTYIWGITDLSTYITSIAFDSVHKSVVDYAGEHAGMPDAVRELEETIDQIVGSETWVRR